ncbi:TPA: fibrillarin-like rRNA/tRNA 2'-O-methyltransferase [Candidatus Micrarchaeota archaeon]|nr:fibrillarin-like rRNA/tRNA 2'-O-methyltransferase [Candidatus Micrarchaeota archaeon]
MQELFKGVYFIDKFLSTKNAVPGKAVYGERLIRDGGTEYRAWDPFRSKLAAAIRKGMKTFPFAEGVKVLYLGASTGTTPSHVSDIVGPDGEIYAVEISAHCMKSLIRLAEQKGRENIIPILGDANKPDSYEEVGEVEVMYQDVSQPNQDEILIKNSEMFLKKGGIAMIAIKSQSIDVTKKPEETFAGVLDSLSTHFEVLEKMKLEPFDKDHLFVVLRKK